MRLNRFLFTLGILSLFFIATTASAQWTSAGGTTWTNDSVAVGQTTAATKLDVNGEVTTLNLTSHVDPPNDTTPGVAFLGLRARAAGGGTNLWRIQTAAVGGGWGVAPGALTTWEYPSDSGTTCCRQRFAILPSSATVVPQPVWIDGLGNLAVGGYPFERLYVNVANGEGYGMGGNGTTRARLSMAVNDWVGMTINAKYVYPNGWVLDDVGKPGWFAKLDARNGVDNFAIYRVPTGPNYHQDERLLLSLDAAGNFSVAGNIGAKYQDVAEWVPAAGEMEPGVVVVLDSEKTNEVMPSQHAYDSAVAGVVSANPGVILGEPGVSKAKIATTGRVRVHADGTRAPIRVGDLLVTSDKPGMAMRSEPVDVAGVKLHRPGTLIGKALEPLPSGQGDILVLLSLQ